MRSDRDVRGTAVGLDRPDWEPLLKVVGEDGAASFMCMFAVETTDGRRLIAYKHIETRRYLHLDREGNAFE